MRRSLGIAVAVLAAVSSVGWASAAPKPRPDQSRPPLGANPHPVIWTSTRPKPAAAAPQQSRTCSAAGPRRNDRDRSSDRHGHDAREHHSRVYVYRQAIYVPVYPEYAYGCYQDGMPDDWGCPWTNGGIVVPPPQVGVLPQPPEPEPPQPRGTSERSVALAWKFIGYGDAQFAKRQYAEANNRYRKAASNAPQLADALFREAFALSAMGRSDLQRPLTSAG